ncbi:MAG: hypothetical protein R3Y11_01625 [Pseudomonadota bacterium]
MEIAKFFAAFVYAVNAFLSIYQKAKIKARAVAVRTNTGAEWLRQLGGKSASSSDADDS